MAAPKRFRIPTLDEMEHSNNDKEAQAVFKCGKKELTLSSASTVKSSDSSVKVNLSDMKKTDSQNTTEPSRIELSRTEPSRLRSDNGGISSGFSLLSSAVSRNEMPENSTSISCQRVAEVHSSDDPAKCVPLAVARPGGSSNSLIVNTRQRGNPLLKSVRNVPWEYGNIVADYVMGQNHCALFLSLRYHQLHPEYIHERLKLLGKSYDLRVLLVQVDVKESHHLLKGLAKICLLSDCTLILAFSPEEASRYLESYKIFENKPPEAIMEKTEESFMAKLTDCLTTVKSVNKTDCSTLVSHFWSVTSIIQASEEDLSLCPGFGPQKAKRLHSLFHEPFLRPRSGHKHIHTEGVRQALDV